MEQCRPNILYVDDHQDTLVVAAKMLGIRGYSVTTAMTIKSAFERARQTRFDLLVVDIELPDGDGSEILAQVRKMYPVPGIVVSGYGMPEDVQKSLAAGFERHLTKPINIAELCKSIAQILENKSSPLPPRIIPDLIPEDRPSGDDQSVAQTYSNSKESRRAAFRGIIKGMTASQLKRLTDVLRRSTSDFIEELEVMRENIAEQEGKRTGA